MNKPIVKILVCCHKPGEWLSDDVYMPIQCGKAISKYDLGIQGDDTGDNISAKNPYYCELTALYWAWKNLKNVDYIGLCHYRRYFNFNSHSPFLIEGKNVSENIFFHNNNKNIPINEAVVLPAHQHFLQPLIDAHIRNAGLINFCILEKVILKLYPEYVNSVRKIFYNTFSLPQRNMFIMKKSLFDDYAKWLFHILFEVEKYLKLSPYRYESRVFGFMGEMLLPLYCYHNRLSINKRQLSCIIDESNDNAVTLLLKMIAKYIRFQANAHLRDRDLYSEKYDAFLRAEGIEI